MAENNKLQKQDEFGQATPAREQSKVKRGGRGKKRVALNAFDLIIIFLVLLVVVLLAIGVRVGDIFGMDEGVEVRLTYTVLFTDVDEDFIGKISEHDLVYDADSGVAFGRVQGRPSISDHCEVGLVSDAETGTQVAMKPLPGRKDITVTVTCDALYYKGHGYEIEGRTVRIGDVYMLRFPDYVGSAVCSSLTAQKAN